MKKLLSLATFILLQAFAFGQTIPNGGFESWTSATYDYPQNFPDNSNAESFFRCNAPFNCVKTTDAYQGTYALMLNTAASGADTCFGFIVNALAHGDPSTWTGGFPYTETPTGMSGYFKCNTTAGDSGGILVEFRGGGNLIGLYTYKFGGVQSTYAPFSFTFSPPLPMAPDSIIFAMVSSDVFNNVAINGSMLQLDSVSLTGGVSQPAMFDGSFEQWQSQTLDKLNIWHYSNREGDGIAKTADNHSGNYAVQLTTHLGEDNGNPTARAGHISTGYCEGDTSCIWQGGIPFSNMVDTLAFYYKYAPVGNDTAQVSLMFKNGGNMFWNQGISLSAPAGTYQYAEIPFSLGQTPDSVIIEVFSSSFNDTTLSFIGSELKIDDMFFKVSTVGVPDVFGAMQRNFVFPNPVNNTLSVLVNTNSASNTRLAICDMAGRTILSEEFVPAGNIHTINASSLQSGVYIIELAGDKGIRRSKFVKE